MEQDPEKNELVTKGYLKIQFEEFEERLDIKLDKKLDQRFTQFEQNIYKLFEKSFDKLYFYVESRLEPLEEMRKDYYKFKDHVTKTLDWLVGAYQKFDDEHEFLSSQHFHIKDSIDEHEKRISLLEKNKLRKKNQN